MFSLFNTAGPTAGAQKELIVHMVLIMLVVVIPVLILLFYFAWKYRMKDGDDGKAHYEAEKPHKAGVELALWVIPIVVVLSLWGMTWQSAHDLDPYKPINSNAAPLTIEVVALPWKWLFIYPDQNIATVNYIVFPENTPVHFKLTADGPISSFWIPQLGTQIYAMATMETQLYTIASSTGEYIGKNTEINGDGYSRMTFVAKSVSNEDFATWVQQTKQENASSTLDLTAYTELSKPSMDVKPVFYSSIDSELFNNVMMKFMMPEATQGNNHSMDDMPGMKMPPGTHMMPGMNM